MLEQREPTVPTVHCPVSRFVPANRIARAIVARETALARYKKVPYDKLHDYIADSLVEWYDCFKPDAAGTEDDERRMRAQRKKT